MKFGVIGGNGVAATNGQRFAVDGTVAIDLRDFRSAYYFRFAPETQVDRQLDFGHWEGVPSGYEQVKTATFTVDHCTIITPIVDVKGYCWTIQDNELQNELFRWNFGKDDVARTVTMNKCITNKLGLTENTLTLDIVVPATRKTGRGMNERSQLLCIRLLVLFFIAVSSVLAIVQAKSSVTFIAQLMGISWGALAGAFLAPFLYGLYSKKTTPAAVWTSFACGVGVMVGCMYCSFTGQTFISPFFTSPINAGGLAMVLGLVVVPVVSLFTRVPDKEHVAEIFSCYEREVTVHASTSLIDDDEWMQPEV